MESTLATIETNFLPPIGYDNIISHVSNLIKSNNLPNVNLICSPKGTGKRLLCEYLSSIILDFNSALYSDIALHPDLLVIDDGNLDSNKKEITVDITRKIKNFLSLTPSQSKYQIVVIDAVDSLNKHASNSILKILEESASNKYFLLICHNQNKILDTIRSRCHKINLQKLNKQNFDHIIGSHGEAEISEEYLDILYKIFPQQPGLAIDFMNSQGMEILEDIQNFNNETSFMEIKQFSNKYDWKNLDIFNNFYTIVNYLTYRHFISSSKSENYFDISQSEKFLSTFRKKFLDTNSLNLDRKNFTIDIVNQVRMLY